MKSALYFLSLMMFLGLGVMIWSSYKAVTVVQESGGQLQNAGQGNANGSHISNPEVSRYVTVSYVGLGMFLLGALGGIIAAVKVMVHRF
jgi:hypothetical protein